VYWLTNLKVRTKMLIAAAVPLLTFAVCSAAIVYVGLQIHFENLARARLEVAATFLTHAGRLGLMSRSPTSLRQPVHTVLADPEIVYVAVYSPDGELLYAHGSRDVPPPPGDLRIDGSDMRYGPSGMGLRELVRVVRYPRDQDTPELLGFIPELDSEGARAGEPEGIIRIMMSTERQDAGYRRMIGYSGVGVVIILGLGAMVTLAISRVLVRAIEQLVRAAREIGAGNHEIPISVEGGPEVEVLAHAFNEMSAEIHAYQRDMERRVEERTAELNSARLEAERASQAKTQFLANMSHEIRTPMTAILGFTELILEEATSLPADAREQLEVIRRNGNHLLALLNDILDIARIEAGRLELEQIPMSPGQLVSEVASSLRMRAKGKGLELGVRFVTPIPDTVDCDPTRVRQVLMNLVGNAIKFTPSGRVDVDLSYDPQDQVLKLEIRDTGIGIPAEKLPTLFRFFDQVDSSMTRRFGGTGLGLAISKRLAKLLGGDCTAESEAGAGSTFTFTCRAPMSRDAELVELAGEALGRVDEERSAAQDETPLSARILLAEDGHDNQRLISRILRRAGADVVVAQNGRVAIQRMQHEQFDLILMDMAMPEMDGYEATQTLRHMGFSLPIIALTAHAMTSDRARCLEAGCSDYLAKPVDREQLLATIRAELQKTADGSGESERG
jgi:signal transduction histidine kinase/CheY-like chemotaxis protein